ncbi:GntR family transcriptional regulator [Hwanghaeella grinnelliae]|uniref:GntR family transcriptional regulator n=1 Tax=Hwanghaeella grinnelliae TaxID=2500179 RepID=A0A437QNA2_9PROT|nr:GntR family transcriptional regulator [Hwanghaeella grinnelliae]RVU35992.1 GntR family transcriptional regulator [Hwanghaeella grinnelliae]
MMELPEIVRSPSLAAMAKRLIQEAIWSGQLAPGAHLVETALAEQFQISRGPLREALKSLASEGLVEFHPGRGAFVVDPTPEQLQDMIIMRAVLGGMAGRYVTAKADASVFERLEESLEKMRAAVDRNDEKGFFDENWVFYDILHRASNEFIFRSWHSLYGLINIYVRRLGRPYVPLHATLRGYYTFVDLLKSGDPDEAEAVLRSQMLRVGFIVLNRPIPPMLHAYVTRRVLDDGSVQHFDPAAEQPQAPSQAADSERQSRHGS